MFRKILIANRGEIACRIMRTAKRLGIKTVAIYSDADAKALHVALADEAFLVGGALPAESYLRTDRIIEACRESGAEAVHPGYGFLSENPVFAEAVTAAGLVFIGPPASAIRAMGLKDAAKELMQNAGVAVVPGYNGQNQDSAFLENEAGKIGYPVLIKARAGGGGRGMRRVDRRDDFKAALESARREAKSSFGDDHCLVEKYLNKPRHIEVQVFGDSHGNIIHLFERDCSLQRRHQKVIEEAPAPGIDADMRRAIGETAVRAAKAIGYAGAGTIEFVADASHAVSLERIYFMEMNTRLQVEHPVTEAITGLDLVEWQLRVAAGEPLPLKQGDISLQGWAFEARICSEDVGAGFLPSTGTIRHLLLPSDLARIECGVQEGEVISPFYDSMIAKIIVHGPNRQAALNKLAQVLERSHVAGVVTNIPFLRALCANETFQAGDVDTGLVGNNLDTLIQQTQPSTRVQAIAAIAALGMMRPRADCDPWESLAGWRHWTEARQFALLEWNNQHLDIRILDKGQNHYEAQIGNECIAIEMMHVNGDSVRFRIGGRIANATIIEYGSHLTVQVDGRTYEFSLPDRLTHSEEVIEDGGDLVASPMPGVIKALKVTDGAKVKKGDLLAIVEAMKMEHTLTAPRDGIVAHVFVSLGDHVENGARILTLQAADG